MLYVIDPEKLKSALLPLTMNDRGKMITKAVAAMLEGKCQEPWVVAGKKTVPPVPKKYTVLFEDFWKHYPRERHVGKKPAFKSWWRAAHQDFSGEVALHVACMRALEWQRETQQWKEGFIPHPTTYLNQARWEDEKEPDESPAESPKPMDWEEFD